MEVAGQEEEAEVAEDVADDDDEEDDAMDDAERLLRWQMVEGEEEIPPTSGLPSDATIDQRVVDLQQRLDDSLAHVRSL